ncbi:MAG TPA: dihydropteroate synthase [Nitrososphaeraceae archaeon]|nr:dihydropteroate synthase [Nitrososphaeraceae archaeon]
MGIKEEKNVKIMGIINCSPESFYKASIRTKSRDVSYFAKKIEAEGADLLDVGGMSTAPYLDTIISPEKEIRRLRIAIKAIKRATSIPVSVDTPRADVAEEAIHFGADVVNDVCGLKYDDKMGEIVAKYGVKIILGAYEKNQRRISENGGISYTKRLLYDSIRRAKESGINNENIIIDPSIGFFRQQGNNPFFTKIQIPWYLRDLNIISNLHNLTKIGNPLCISLSRKSFLGELLKLKSGQRLAPSLILEAISVLKGASIIRTHNVRDTFQMLLTLNRFDRISI